MEEIKRQAAAVALSSIGDAAKSTPRHSANTDTATSVSSPLNTNDLPVPNDNSPSLANLQRPSSSSSCSSLVNLKLAADSPGASTTTSDDCTASPSTHLVLHTATSGDAEADETTNGVRFTAKVNGCLCFFLITG